jgi:hypothetical protein
MTLTQQTDAAVLHAAADHVRIDGANYGWSWSAADDRFTLLDGAGRTVLTGTAAPAPVLARDGERLPVLPLSVHRFDVDGDTVVIDYRDDRGLLVRTRWRAQPHALWFGGLELDATEVFDVVEVMYFGRSERGTAQPGVRSDWLVHPCPVHAAAVGSVLPMYTELDLRLWVGRGSHTPGDVSQQWALPAHFVCAASTPERYERAGAFADLRSDAVCLGLAALPQADHLLQLRSGRWSPVLQFRSDLWHQLRTGAGPIAVGVAQVMVLGRDPRDAQLAYYRLALREGLARPPASSPVKADTLGRSMWNSWGGQMARGDHAVDLTQDLLDGLLTDIRELGVRPGMYCVDAKWEGAYGLVRHSEERLPAFVRTLDGIRAAGMKVGLWAAFMRCADPAAVGLTPAHMLQGVDGQPIKRPYGDEWFYLYDASQPDTREVLTRLAREFAATYRPDLIKFDFGYELPSLAECMPFDPSWGGEVLLRRCLEVIVDAVREVLPDVVIMYYHLSPLLNDLIDLTSSDDNFGAMGDTHLVVNRCGFWSSSMAVMGVPFYGSSGYEWRVQQQVWFDSALLGPAGALLGVDGDVWGARPTADDAARFNGVSDSARPHRPFTIEPLEVNVLGGSGGARASSWLRFEDGTMTGAAVRTTTLDGLPADPVVTGVLRTDAQVLVVAQDDRPLDASAHLSVVPFAPGRLTLHRAAGDREAQVTTHLLGAESVHEVLPIRGGVLDVPLVLRHGQSPVERVEVRVR